MNNRNVLSKLVVYPTRCILTRKFSGKKYETIGVIGLGLMGHGIAQISAQAGYKVLAIEMNEDALKTGLKRIEGMLCKLQHN